jgi:hypothetical protein
MMTAAPARMTIQTNNDGDGSVSPVVWSYESRWVSDLVYSGLLFA